AASRAGSREAGLWQNTLTWNGRSVLARTAAIMRRVASASTAPEPIEPTAPALATAAAISGVDTPAIGAWIIGSSIPSLRRKGSKRLSFFQNPKEVLKEWGQDPWSFSVLGS